MQSSVFFDFCSISFTSFLVHSQCSKTCGRGLRKRSVFCRSTDPGAKAVVVPDSMCRQHHKPKAQETCVLRRCPKNERLQWIPAPWGEVGKKNRHEAQEAVVTCLDFSLIILRKNPPLKHWKSVISFWWCSLLSRSVLLLVGAYISKCRRDSLTLKHFQHSYDLQLRKTSGVNIKLWCQSFRIKKAKASIFLKHLTITQGEIHHTTERAVSQPAASVDQNAMQHQDPCFIWTGKTISAAGVHIAPLSLLKGKLEHVDKLDCNAENEK